MLGHLVLTSSCPCRLAPSPLSLQVGQRVGFGWIKDSCRGCSNCIRGLENLCLKGYTGTIVMGEQQTTNTYCRPGPLMHPSATSDRVQPVPPLPHYTPATCTVGQAYGQDARFALRFASLHPHMHSVYSILRSAHMPCFLLPHFPQATTAASSP